MHVWRALSFLRPLPLRVPFAWLVTIALHAITAVGGRAEERESQYLEQVRPVLYERCIACHGALKQEAGLRLDTAENALRGGESGPAVSLASPATSLILERVSSPDPDLRMPPEGEPLHASQIEAWKKWIEQGALYPANEKGEADPSSHWAFQPPVAAPVPKVGDSVGEEEWGRNPIDAWLAAARIQRGLAHQPPAPKSLWLRRVYLDLIGLPPTPDEVAQFEKDTDPLAKERVIDRLLQSPQYGERWGRHWMDIWRYSDWWGLGEEVRNSQKHIWHWRDWIVESLNSDKGYDQMLREMLAADELYPNDLDRLRATGYLARQYFKFNRTSWLDETIEHTAKGMLGLTFNCAKCHDHKYDPFSQEDYYRFRAFFEPYQVRMDVVSGQSDLARDGIPRAFDCNLEAATYLHFRGDDRNPDVSRPLSPAVPGFLGGPSLQIAAVPLPLEAVHPGLRGHVRDTLAAGIRAKLEEANAKLQALRGKQPSGANPVSDWEVKIAELDAERWKAERVALEWRYQADMHRAAHPDQPSTSEVVARAAYFDRRVELAEARLQQAQAQRSLDTASQDKIAEARSRKDAADANVETLLKQVDAPGERYRSLQGAEKTAESNLETDESRRKPFPAQSSGRRSALAQWMTDRSNPLVARVAVNHVWARHFGKPLVPTVFDFGRKGTLPVHRELLDYLAVELMENQWSLKHLHRLMTSSKTYAMSTTQAGISDVTLREDPDNLHYWRMHSGRMESQAVRDSLLLLSGDLELRLGGPSIPTADAASRRRSIYYFQSHNEHEKFLAIFDDANVLDCYRRARSVVPQQALAMENSPLVQSASEKLADRILGQDQDMNDDEFIRRAFQWVLATDATPSEIARTRDAMVKWRESAKARGWEPDRLARCGVVRSLLNHNDFITIR